MTACRSLAWRLADCLPGLDAPAMGRHPVFREAAAAALAVLDEGSIVERVVAQGGLAGARNVHAVVVARLRAIPVHVQDRYEAAVEREAVVALNSPRARALRAAAERGVLLRAHVERGSMTRQEALDALEWECKDGELLDVGLAAFERRAPGLGLQGRRACAVTFEQREEPR